MKLVKMFLVAGSLFAAANAQIDTTQQHYWMMTYFISTQEGVGARLAFSSDSNGINWEYYNNQAVFLAPTLTGADGTELMRDPMIEFDSTNNKFNFVWTISWVGTTIGWDTSSDLINWGKEVALNVGAAIPGCYCCWAPEIFWDDIKGEWQIYWATAITSGGDKEIFYSDIPGQDFTKFTTPKLLFYPKFTVIDADMMKLGPNSYVMDFKDERNSTGATQSKNVHLAFSKAPSGPFKGPDLFGNDTTMSRSCTYDSIQEAEGPTLVKQGGQFHLFFDPFNQFNSTYRMVKTSNIDTTGYPWAPSATLMAGNSNFYYNHSNVIEVPRRFVMNLLYGQALPTPPVAPTLQLPVNGDTGQTSSSTLAWAASPGATGYNVQISTSSTFAVTVYGSKGGLATTMLAPALTAGNTTYYWRVNSANANAGAGPWSQVWSFTTGASAVLPGAPEAIRPTCFSVANGIISYSVKTAGPVEFSFKDMLGRTALMLNRTQAAGKYSIALNGYNLASGRYIVSFKNAGIEESASVTLGK